MAISRDNPAEAPHFTDMRRLMPLVILIALAVAGFAVDASRVHGKARITLLRAA